MQRASSARMTPVQSFHPVSPKQQHQQTHHPSGGNERAVARPIPSPLTLPKSSSSPIIRNGRSSPLQDSSTQSIHLSGNATNILRQAVTLRAISDFSDSNIQKILRWPVMRYGLPHDCGSATSILPLDRQG